MPDETQQPLSAIDVAKVKEILSKFLPVLKVLAAITPTAWDNEAVAIAEIWCSQP